MRPLGRSGLLAPSYGGRSIANLAAGLFDDLGPKVDRPVGLLPPLARELDPFRDGRPEGPVVLFLVDGLGWSTFVSWARGAPEGRSSAWGEVAHPITTVFPSTTTAALYSLATGTAPSFHGLLGYRQFLPRFGAVVDMLKLSPVGLEPRDLLVGPFWAPEVLGATPTLARQGLPTTALTRDRFLRSGFTRLLYDGARCLGYATGSDLAGELIKLLGRRSPRLLLVYWDGLDTIQHLRGLDPSLVEFELGRTLELMEHVAARLPHEVARRTTLLVTGDHGQVPAAPGARVAVETVPAIVRELARPPSGDRRATFLSARPGRLGALQRALRARLPDRTPIVRIETALSLGLFGPPPYHPELRERVGDLVVLPPSPATVTYRLPGMAAPARFLPGAHGGLEPDELLVPLIAARLDRFAALGPRASSKR